MFSLCIFQAFSLECKSFIHDRRSVSYCILVDLFDAVNLCDQFRNTDSELLDVFSLGVIVIKVILEQLCEVFMLRFDDWPQ